MANYNYSYNPASDQAAMTHNSDKPIKPEAPVFSVRETVVVKPTRGTLDTSHWRKAHRAAEDAYWPDRSWLYDLYDDISLDLHLTGIIQKRIDTVLNKQLKFEIDGKEDEEMTKLMRSSAFREAMKHMLEAQLWGLSGLEFVPGEKFEFKKIPRKHIKPKWQIISVEQNSDIGLDYTKASNILIVGDKEDDLGLLLKCAPYVIYKRNNTGDWAQYIEIFGQPIRIMYYDPLQEQAKLELKQTLDETGGSMALMIPQGVQFDIKDGKVTNGDGQLQDTFKDFLNAEMSVGIIGNTETTTNGKTGTGAKSNVHAKQQDEIIKSDIAYLEGLLNDERFLQIVASYGYRVEGGSFRFSQEINIEFLGKMIEIDEKLSKLVPLDPDELYKVYGRTKPKNFEELMKNMRQQRLPITEAELVDDPADDPEHKPQPKQPVRKVTHNKLRNFLTAVKDFFDPALS